MKNRLPKKYYIIPILYIALVFGFLHLHLNEGDGRMVTQSLGSVTLRYREENGVRKNISRLNLEYAGMTADLSDGVPVMDASGRIDLVPINGVSLEERHLILFLDGGGSIEFAEGFSLEGGIRSVEAVEEEPPGGIAVVYRTNGAEPVDFFPILSLDIPESGDLRQVHEEMPLLRLRDGDGIMLMAHGGNSGVEEGKLVLRFEGASKPGMFSAVETVLSDLSEEKDSGEKGTFTVGMVAADVPDRTDEELLGYWFFGEKTNSFVVGIEQLVEEKSGMMADFWRLGGEADGERVVTAMAAYSMENGGGKSLGEIAELRDTVMESGSFLGGPFIGNIMEAEENYGEGLEQELLQQVDLSDREGVISTFATSGKSTFYPSIPSALVYAGEDQKLRSLVDSGEELLGSGVDSSSALAGIFIVSVEVMGSYDDLVGDAASLAREGYRQMLPFIGRVGPHLFYRAFAGGEKGESAVYAVDPVLQIKLGRALQQYGFLEGEELARELGSFLLESVLSFIDQNGALPAELSLEAGTLKPTESKIPPATFYPYLSTTTYYPRVVSLRKELDRDLRVWTAAQGVGAVQRADGFDITLDFAVGETEFVVIRGVDSFSALNMYGLRWNGDFRFQNYDVGGWYYDQAQKKLYLKIRHNDKVERIRVFD